MKSKIPYKLLTEEELVSLVEKTVGDTSDEAKYKRREALDELRKREINNEERVVDVLISVAEKHYLRSPELDMIVPVLSKLANSSENVFQKLRAELQKSKGIVELEEREIGKYSTPLHCVSKIIPNLDVDKKKRIVEPLINVLMSMESFSNTTNELYEALICIGESDWKEVVEAAKPYLDSQKPVQIVYATRIVSRLANEQLTPELIRVLERSREEWYNANNYEVQKAICGFFQRVRDKRGFPYLLKLLKEVSTQIIVEVKKALASIIDNNQEFMDDLMKAEIPYPLKLNTLLELKEAKVDIDALFELVPPEDLEKSSIKVPLKVIVVNSGESAKKKLLEMVKNDSHAVYSFALDCLNEISVTIDEISACFEEDPVSQVYRFFYGKNIERIWEAQDTLRDSIEWTREGRKFKKAQIRRLDHFIQNLFSALKFVTLYVEPSGREGVDVVAFSPFTTHLFIIGCTTGLLKDDLQKIDKTLKNIDQELPELVKKYQVVPIVITTKNVQIHPSDREYAHDRRIVILKHEEVDELIRMLKTRRNSKYIVKYIVKDIYGIE